MILILSNNGDLSTDYVCDFLRKVNHPFMRLNSDDLVDKNCSVLLQDSSFKINYDQNQIDLNTINVVWLRKFGDFHTTSCYEYLINNNYHYEIIEELHIEFKKTVQLLFYILKDKYWLTKYTSINPNKVALLDIASKCGFNIPPTIVTNNKNGLDINKTYISKSIDNPINIDLDNKSGFMYTSVISSKEIETLPNHFQPSLIQELIEKEYEIRVFYICGKSYPMAIFSQNDPQTKTDFRKYNDVTPNRFVPCKLNEDEQDKIHKLMTSINLNCGSLDFIKSTDGKLYFLEVNPTGQFGMVDFPCNYGLHEIVANKLIEMDNYETKTI